jgi:catechol 2,3-dioxygenase-like lactoylglutathione lyase family enzyme
MLGDHPVFPILLSTDMERSRAFYHETLGLPIAREDDERIVLQCAAGTVVAISRSTVGTRDTQTQAAWRVADIRAELAELRARGVKIEHYEAPDPPTDGEGIADMGVQWAAWFTDPSGNVLALIQPKSPPGPPATGPGR